MSIYPTPEGSGEPLPSSNREIDNFSADFGFRFYMYSRLQGLLRLDSKEDGAAMEDAELAAETESDKWAVFMSDDEGIPVNHHRLVWRPISPAETERLDVSVSYNPELVAGIDYVAFSFPEASVGVMSATPHQSEKKLLKDIYVQVVYVDGSSARYLSNSLGINAYSDRQALTSAENSLQMTDILTDEYMVECVDTTAPPLTAGNIAEMLLQGRFRRQAA